MGTSKNSELQGYLREHISFIQASAHSFDAGFEGEAKRMAVSARVLMHDTPQSHSLMGQLCLLNVPFYSTAGRWDPNNLLTHHGLLQIRISGSGSSYHAPLDDRPPHMLRWVPFNDWWSEIVFDDRKGSTITRKHLVLTLANKEGGAHVDPKLSPAYEAITRKNTLGWVSTDNKLPLSGQVAFLGMRQMAHEILRTLERSGYK